MMKGQILAFWLQIRLQRGEVLATSEMEFLDRFLWKRSIWLGSSPQLDGLDLILLKLPHGETTYTHIL